MSRNILYCIGLLSIFRGLQGCATAEPPDPPTIAAAPVVAATQLAPSEADPAAGDELYTYNTIGKRDPFRDVRSELCIDTTEPPKYPLELFELDQLKVVAVVVGTAAPRAMIEDPAGVGHIVRIGELIGRHRGQIRFIRREGVIVREEFRKYTGERVSTLITLPLPEEKVETLKSL
jgi:type IV pilus assembly protein PilP